MKKLIAISFLLIYLLNLSGYSLFFDYLINKTDKQLIAHLDTGNYNDASLTEIKIPVHMPYIHNQLEYERWDGSVELNGVLYNYVKRKLYNDTLYLLCLPNISKTELHNAKTAYAAGISDMNAGDSKKPVESSLKKMIFENNYDRQDAEIEFPATRSSLTHLQYLSAYLASCYIPSHEQPPEFYC